MTVLHVGIAPYEDMKDYTLAIAKGDVKPRADAPKVWFTSIESFARVLSERNRALLDLIAARQPKSLAELEVMSGRAKSNLSRTLKTMARYGLVQLEKSASGTLVPKVPYSVIKLDLPMGRKLSTEPLARKLS
jgi:predicted transcriptional regulator